jgi:hypothetical protein
VLRDGRHTQTVEVLTDDPATPKIPIELEITVYPLVIATPAAITLPRLGLQADLSRIVIPTIYVRKVRGDGLEVKRVTSTLPFLKFELQTEKAGEAYTVRSSLDKSGISGTGNFEGKIRIETNDPDVPVLEVVVRGAFY